MGYSDNKTNVEEVNKDKYLLVAEAKAKELELLKVKLEELKGLISSENSKASDKEFNLNVYNEEIKRLNELITGRKKMKKDILSTIGFNSVVYSFEVILASFLPETEFINLFFMTFTIYIFFTVNSALSILKKYGEVDIKECEEKIKEFEIKLPGIEAEKQLYLDKAESYAQEHEEANEKITKIEKDIEYILNIRNQIIDIMLKKAIDFSLVDTSCMDQELEENGVVMKLV